jgi:formylglycine-generating enzyme required for sulfatase activity
MKILVILAAVLCIHGTIFAACPSMDLSRDCVVNVDDFSLLAGQWLADYDDTDLMAMASQWLTEGIPDQPHVMLWVHINEPGFNGYMSKYETTNAQYCEYLNAAKAANLIKVATDNLVYAASDTMNSTPYFSTYAAYAYSQITYSDGVFSVRSRNGYSMNNHPVTSVTWYGAMAFCTAYGFRLPTESEWQAVADYDGTFTYGCGLTINQNKANYRDGIYANPLGLTSFPYTSPIGYYPGFGYGMCDMAGNVIEWTSTASGIYRVLRGGDWYDGYSYCTVVFRNTIVPYASGYFVGFRVCH